MDFVFPSCKTHYKDISEYQCKDCNVTICSYCRASEEHKGHTFVEIKKHYKINRKTIERDQEELKVLISPSYEKIVFDLEIQITNLDEDYEELKQDLSKQGEEWRREIDIVIKEKESELNNIKEKHRSILIKHLDEIKQIQSLIKQSLLELKDIEESDELSKIIEYTSKIREFCKLPSKVTVSMPCFIPKPTDREKLHGYFGEITPLFTAKEQNVLLPKTPYSFVKEPIDEPELLATIQACLDELRCVACVNEEQIWTSGRTNEIKCFNMEGKLLQSIGTISTLYPGDIAVDCNGNLLYTDSAKMTVNKLEKNETEILIRLQGWVPTNLHVASNGNLLVAMYSGIESPFYGAPKIESKVVRYSGATEKQTIQYDEECSPLYSGSPHLKFIAENKNLDICVSDSDAGTVVVVDKVGKLRWKYNDHSSSTLEYEFQPYGITTDSQSQVLVADHYNRRIHILDENGGFLRYIDNLVIMSPFGVCVDYYDNLFVCEYLGGNVKKIKYSI